MGITTKDLALLCGVSRTTVHRALHNTGRINEETKEMILKIAKEHDYRPDMLARGLVKGKTFYIGVVIMDSDNRYFSQMLNAIVREARKIDYSVNITFHENKAEIEREQLCRLADYHMDGIILSSINKGEEYKEFLKSLEIPIVTIDNKVAKGIPFVGIDGKKAAAEAAEKIVQKNYERVIFVCPPLADAPRENVYVHEERAKGFKETMDRYPEVEQGLIQTWEYLEPAYEVLLNTDKRTAFFCTSDMIALELMRFLQLRGKKVVKDYGIMGFDNIDILRYVSPRLSTIYNSVEEVAQTSVSLLFDLINEKKVKKERIVKYRPVDGDTLG